MLKIARVVIDSTVKKLDVFYDYLINDDLDKNLAVGMRVEVPFGKGNMRRVGYVIKIYEGDGKAQLKEITKIIDETPLIDRQRLVEAFWVKNRYFSTFSEAIKLFLPFGSSVDLDEMLVLCADAEVLYKWAEGSSYRKRIADKFTENNGKIAYSTLRDSTSKQARMFVNNLYEHEIIDSYHIDKTKAKDLMIKTVRLREEADAGKIAKNALAQQRAFKVLSECDLLSVSDLCLFACCAKSTVEALFKKGIVEYGDVEIFRNPNKKRKVIADTPPVLTDEQENAVEVVLNSMKSGLKPTLIRGVTGSGKTEVYLRVIENVIQEEGNAIILVPEISLTHQMIERFMARFGSRLAVLHSALSVGERYDEWKRISSGRAKVVIGARSAVFAPCPNLKIIIIDEEHESTYKSESGVRYNAVEVAGYRAKYEKASLILGSATPSVTSYYKAKSGFYNLVEMERRTNNAPLPRVIIADMRKEIEKGNRTPFSDVLKNEIKKNIEKGEQSILFLNRRGYATFVSCRSCGFVAKCPNCNISLTYHAYGDSLVCHYCGFKKKVYSACPSCESRYIQGFGTGTQKIEEKICEEFKNASLIRMDNDTTRKRDSHEKILGRFQDENINILLGTQMISKGLDFENVTLVGVLAADQVLNMGDFRAGERTFNLITQVCGRAGRGEKEGRAVIQTYMPDNGVIINASKHDYKTFYEEEIIMRKALNYPPFCDIINVMVSGTNQSNVQLAAETMQKTAAEMLDKHPVTLYKAAPCHIDKIKNSFRWHFWLKCNFNKDISEIIGKIIQNEKKLSVIADLNPNII